MIELFKRTHWEVWYETLTKGNPPLIMQLLAINSVIFIFLIIRRMRGRSAVKNGVGQMIQALLIGANLVILTQDQFMPFYHSHLVSFWHKFMNVI